MQLCIGIKRKIPMNSRNDIKRHSVSDGKSGRRVDKAFSPIRNRESGFRLDAIFHVTRTLITPRNKRNKETMKKRNKCNTNIAYRCLLKWNRARGRRKKLHHRHCYFLLTFNLPLEIECYLHNSDACRNARRNEHRRRDGKRDFLPVKETFRRIRRIKVEGSWIGWWKTGERLSSKSDRKRYREFWVTRNRSSSM